jgi:aspartate racemase
MKIIGLIGGMSWESSAEYYRIINETVNERLGGLHSAKCMMYSLDMNEINILQHEGRWDEVSILAVDAAKRVERGGAEFIVLCTNTVHKLAESIEMSVNIPLLHIADATAKTIKNKQLLKVGLIGTRFTMEHEFYKGRLKEKHGIEVVIPNEEDRQIIHDVIYNELCKGELNENSRAKFQEIINRLVEDGAEGIILGCTEIPLLVKEEDVEVPIFNTTRIHAEAAVEYALED